MGRLDRRKGQTWQVEEMLKLFLVILVFGGSVLLIIGATGGLTNVLREFCEKNPSWCGEQPTENYYKIARASVEALVTAIKCVSNPGHCPTDCTDDNGCIFYSPFEPGGGEYGGGGSSGGTGNIIGGLDEPFDIESEDTSNTNTGDDIVLKCTTKPSAIKEPEETSVLQWVKVNEPPYFDCYLPDDIQIWKCHYCEPGFVKTDDNRCRLDNPYECGILNFQLPQDVSNAEDWIAGYGDPNLLVYYQDFPKDQDTWTFRIDWKIIALGAVLTVMPVTRVANSGVKLGLKSLTRRIVTKAALKEAIKDEVKGILTKRLNEKLRALVKASGFTTAVYASRLYDSMNEKYEKSPNKMLLKTPFEQPEEFGLPTNLKGRPVVIMWDPGAITPRRIESAHLVSPCYLDNLKVRFASSEDSNVMVCNAYNYFPSDGSFECLDALEWSSDSILNVFRGDPREMPYCDPERYFGDGNEFTSSLEKLTKIPTAELVGQLEDSYIIEEWVEAEETDIVDVGTAFTVEEDWRWHQGIDSEKPEKIRLTSRDGKSMILTDTLDDNKTGYFDSISIKDCRTDMVLIEIPDDGKKDQDPNYCIHDSGNAEKLFKIGGTVIGVGGALAAGFFSSGSTWVVAASIAGGGLVTGGEIMEYTEQWP